MAHDDQSTSDGDSVDLDAIQAMGLEDLQLEVATEQLWKGYEEESYFDRERKKLDLRDHRRRVTDRGTYTTLLFRLMVVWMAVVLLIVVADGIDIVPLKPILDFNVRESVLLALIGGMSANVIGLFVIVANHLFPRKHARHRAPDASKG